MADVLGPLICGQQNPTLAGWKNSHDHQGAQTSLILKSLARSNVIFIRWALLYCRPANFSNLWIHGENMADSKQSQTGNPLSGKPGFGAVEPDRQREIASEGGKTSRSGSSQQKGQASQESDSQQTAGGQKSNPRPGSGPGTQGGAPEQHSEAGRQSHKNSS
jgi:uncharacterized protein